MNITLIIVHWLMSSSIYNWIENGESIEAAAPAEEEAEPTMDEEEFEEEF